jgi:hypothetical protein
MASARTHCPECHLANAVSLSRLLYSDSAEYFFCHGCYYVWYVPNGSEGPPLSPRDGLPLNRHAQSLQS